MNDVFYKRYHRVDIKYNNLRKFAIAFMVGVIFLSFFVQSFINVYDTSFQFEAQVPDDSTMSPTFGAREYIVVTSNFDIDYGDVVFVTYGTDEKLLFRTIVGFGGDTMYCYDNKLMIKKKGTNAVKTIKYGFYGVFEFGRSYVVPEGELFIIGENDICTFDSKSSDFLGVKEEQVAYKYVGEKVSKYYFNLSKI